MDFPERFENLPLYAFSRLRELLDGVKSAGQEISMTIGEPRHPFPEWVTDIIVKNSAGFNDYPANEGIPELKKEIMENVIAWVRSQVYLMRVRTSRYCLRTYVYLFIGC